MGEKEAHQERTKSLPRLALGLGILLFGLFILVNGVLNVTDNRQRLLTPSGFIEIEIADTPELRTLGLSGRDSLADGEGMLFVFDEVSVDNCFWMKDMQFSIDMIWLDEAKKVISIEREVSPDTHPTSFCPSAAAKYGLEVTSGRASEMQLEPEVQLRF